MTAIEEIKALIADREGLCFPVEHLSALTQAVAIVERHEDHAAKLAEALEPFALAYDELVADGDAIYSKLVMATAYFKKASEALANYRSAKT